jgi:hypothetical protein
MKPGQEASAQETAATAWWQKSAELSSSPELTIETSMPVYTNSDFCVARRRPSKLESILSVCRTAQQEFVVSVNSPLISEIDQRTHCILLSPNWKYVPDKKVKIVFAPEALIERPFFITPENPLCLT